MRTIGERIRSARKAAGLSQEALARKVGVSQGLIGQIETGVNQGTKHIAAIARGLDVSADWLETGHGDRQRSAAPQAAKKSEAMVSPAPWPFAHMTPEFWMSAPESVRIRAEALAEGAILEWKRTQPPAEKPTGKSRSAA